MPVGRSLTLALLAAATVAQAPLVGDAIADLKFTDRRWLPRRLSELGPARGYVVFFTTVDCPLVKRYLPRVVALHEQFGPKGVRFVAINVGAGDALVDAVAQGIEAGFPFGVDFDGVFAPALGVERTATAVVLNTDRELVYRGRVDGQHRFAGTAPRVGREDLREALVDLLENRAVRVAETEVEGCRITPRKRPAANRATFSRDVLPLIQRHCQDCHRPAGEAPFELMTHDDAASNAEMIAEVVVQGRMPPWYGAGSAREFVNHRGLSAEEQATLLGWIAAGCPAGDPEDAPPPRRFSDSQWRIDEPDMVLRVPVPIRLPADGYVPYKYLVLPYNFAEDTWVEAIEILPENRTVLHHCNLIHYKLGEQPSQDGFITGQVPGGDATILDPGTAVRIPAGSALVLQAHYITTGKREIDRLRVGLRFPRVPVQKELRTAIVADFRFEIPAGASAHRVSASRTLRHDALGLGMVAHMHLRGRDLAISAHYPSGDTERLVTVPNYSFDWQQSYRWDKAGKRLPAGTRLEAVAHFDNSAFNPFNPDPNVAVRFGNQTIDEMMYGFVFYVREHEQLGLRVDPKTGRVLE